MKLIDWWHKLILRKKYRILGPNEVIRNGDECATPSGINLGAWSVSYCQGMTPNQVNETNLVNKPEYQLTYRHLL